MYALGTLPLMRFTSQGRCVSAVDTPLHVTVSSATVNTTRWGTTARSACLSTTTDPGPMGPSVQPTSARCASVTITLPVAFTIVIWEWEGVSTVQTTHKVHSVSSVSHISTTPQEFPWIPPKPVSHAHAIREGSQTMAYVNKMEQDSVLAKRLSQDEHVTLAKVDTSTCRVPIKMAANPVPAAPVVLLVEALFVLKTLGSVTVYRMWVD